jgi:hypothetical protein
MGKPSVARKLLFSKTVTAEAWDGKVGMPDPE